MILIATLADDLHAYVICDRLKKKHGVDADILEVDSLLGKPSLTWANDHSALNTVGTISGPVSVEEIRLVWWRRGRADQKRSLEYELEAQRDLVNQDWRASLRGALLGRPNIAWVSRPDATEAASFKMLQLESAKRCGFRVPRTLISNQPWQIKNFLSAGSAVVKAVAGTRHDILITKQLTLADLPEDEVLEVCPAIYQEYVPGTKHIRLNQFGEVTVAFEITSQNLDWRPQLTRDIRHVEIAPDISRRCKAVLDDLQLRMGVFDLKVTPEGEVYFFEVNPQGQFLFLEGITGTSLAEPFCTFLLNEMGAPALCRGAYTVAAD